MPDKKDNYIRVNADRLRDCTSDCLQAHGVRSSDADIVADVLVAADLRGIESHGVARLSSYYLGGLRENNLNPDPDRRFAADAGAIFTVDADNGLGHPACHEAMQKCISLAADSGIAVGGVRNSNHFGIAGYYAMMALEQDMIGLCLTNSQPLVTPTYGRKRTLGTNPIAVAVPTGDRPSFVLDMATSVVPIGKMEVFRRREETVPQSWGADADGLPTDDPGTVVEEGSLFPLGGTADTSGYKGYGLAAVVDILCGVLTGADFLTGVSSGDASEAAGVGHFVAALKIDALMSPKEFESRMDAFINQLKSAPLAENCDEIYVAGEKEHLHHKRNQCEGVPLHPKVYDQLMETCDHLNVQTSGLKEIG